ncbi:hypothetical protein Tco_0462451, partial [Tanacetum coccineum]
MQPKNLIGRIGYDKMERELREEKMAREAESRGLINTRQNLIPVRPNINTGGHNINSVRPKVNAVNPKVNTVRFKTAVTRINWKDFEDSMGICYLWRYKATTGKEKKELSQYSLENQLTHMPVASKDSPLITTLPVPPSVNTGSQTVNTGRLDLDDSPMPELEIFHKSETGIFDEASYDEEGLITDFNSLPTEIEVSPTPTLRIHNIHPKSQILGNPKSVVQTRSRVQQKSGARALLSYIQKQQRNNHKDQQHYLFACFLSQEELKKIAKALQDDSWVQAMQDELLQFKLQQVWVLVDLPHGMKVIGTKWVYRNKRDERGVRVYTRR